MINNTIKLENLNYANLILLYYTNRITYQNEDKLAELFIEHNFIKYTSVF